MKTLEIILTTKVSNKFAESIENHGLVIRKGEETVSTIGKYKLKIKKAYIKEE